MIKIQFNLILFNMLGEIHFLEIKRKKTQKTLISLYFFEIFFLPNVTTIPPTMPKVSLQFYPQDSDHKNPGKLPTRIMFFQGKETLSAIG